MRARSWGQDSKNEINQWTPTQSSSCKIAEPLPCLVGCIGVQDTCLPADAGAERSGDRRQLVWAVPASLLKGNRK